MSEVIVRADCQGATSTPLITAAPTFTAKEPAPLRSRVPVPMTAALPAFTVLTVTPLVRVSVPVGFTVGAAPPMLLKVMPAKLLLPTRFTSDAPPIVSAFVFGMTPPAVWVRMA